MIELIERLARFHFTAKRYGDALHYAEGVTMGERAILKEVSQNGKSVPEMAGWRGLSRQAIQKIVDQLERRGLVRKKTPPSDRRNRIVVITRRGSALVEKLEEAERAEAQLMAQVFPQSELKRTIEALDFFETQIQKRIAKLRAHDDSAKIES